VIALRPYQEEAVERVRRAIRDGRRRILLTLPTGAGKTATGSHILAAALMKGSRSMFVAHRTEIIDQTVSTFYRFGVTQLGVVRAKDPRRNESQPIQVCSIATLARRAHLRDIKVVVIDECHRSCAATYKQHLFDAYPEAVFLGLTATPVRADGKPLGEQWQELVQGARYSELIEGGHIVAPLVYSTPVLPDLATVHTSQGDYDQKELEEAVNRRALIGDLLTQWQKLHGGRRTVAFAVSVAHSKAIVDVFRGAGIRAEHLDGTTPEDERRAMLERLRTHETQLVSQCAVLQEGWDQPECKCLLIARPTKSLGLWMQMAGRCLRPWSPMPSESSVQPLILDHGGNYDRHDAPHLDREWSLTAKPKKAGVAPTKMCPECYAYVGASAAVCEHCGYVFVVKETKPPAPIPVDLALRTLMGEDAQLSFFRRTAKKARERGRMYGWVAHEFSRRFGVDVPREWMRALKEDYRRDVEWQEAKRARDPIREAYAQRGDA